MDSLVLQLGALTVSAVGLLFLFFIVIVIWQTVEIVDAYEKKALTVFGEYRKLLDDEPTDEWGIRVESVEVREVNPSKEVQQAMEQQTSAERRRRAMILEAQGERRSAVETAEGDKQSDIIRAQGEKQSQILEAQGDAISTVLRAKSAEAMGERAIIERGMESLERIGQGESSTFILPQELTSLVGRYGKQLTGSDIQESEGLEGKEFDAETRKMLGLDDIDEILGEIDQAAEMDIEQLEQEAEQVKTGDAGIKSPDEVIDEADDEIEEEPLTESETSPDGGASFERETETEQ